MEIKIENIGKIKDQIFSYKEKLEEFIKLNTILEHNEEIKDVLNKLIELKATDIDINSSKISKTLKHLLNKEFIHTGNGTGTGNDNEISSLTRKLIRKWKDTVQKNKSKIQIEKKEPLSLSTKNNTNNILNPSNSNTSIINLCEESKIENDSNFQNFLIIIQAEKDLSRRNTKLLVYNSLLKSIDDSQLVYTITSSIEEGLYRHFIVDLYNQKTKYLKMAKSIVMNLQNNPDFVNYITTGKFKCEELAQMNPLDFASEASKKRRLELEEDAFNSRRSDWNRIKNPAAIGIYKCGKCKTYKTTYYQLQIRRADEPMTTFVSCLECTHSWKF